MARDLIDAVYGCLGGGAVGDALGAPVVGWDYRAIRKRHGRVEELLASPRDGAGGQPGHVTGTTVLCQHVALALVQKGGRITPGDLVAGWLEKERHPLLLGNECIAYERLVWGAEAWSAGQGADVGGAAAASLAPLGIVNAGNPAQACADAYLVASVTRDGEERGAAAALAAGVAGAVMPDATLDGVLEVVARHATGRMRRALAAALDLADRCASPGEFVEACYRDFVERHAQPHAGGGSHESVPVALALVRLCGGDVSEALVEAAGFGRDASAVASTAGTLAGALAGATAIRGTWLETCEAANRDLFAFMEGDPTANFYATAWRLVSVLRAERLATKKRLALLDRLLR